MYRHELKFLITNVDKTELRNILQHFCHHDRHAIDGFYSISSLYFDDIYHTAYQEKLDGVEIRKKYRIRIYNCSDSVISLECKYKNGQYIHKESVRMTAFWKETSHFCLKRKNRWQRNSMWIIKQHCYGHVSMWYMNVNRSYMMQELYGSPLMKTYVLPDVQMICLIHPYHPGQFCHQDSLFWK